tara:strand:- start:2009 stop:4285 length:2277 start_codon:yes stop_codon:yes gene_type:complete
MPRIRVPISNFQFGEVSPSLVSRTDTNVYQNAGKQVENFFLKNEGGLVKRFGTTKIYEFDTVPDTANYIQQHRLIPFIFSDDEKYLISMEDLKIRCFFIDPSTKALSLVDTITQDSEASPASLPFTKSNLHELTYAQTGDTMIIAHQSFMPRILSRTSLTTFQVTTFAYDQSSDGRDLFQPYHSFQQGNMTLDPSATSGSSITVTTSGAYFDTTGSLTGLNYLDSKHVGASLKYQQSEIQITSVQSATQATGKVIRELYVDLDIDAFRSVDGTADLEVTHINHGLNTGDSITISRAGTIASITPANINGTRTVQEVVDANHYFITAGQNANASVDGGGAPRITTHAPTTEWSEGSWSVYRGYPAAVTFHENRLWFGGTLGQPDGIWASVTNAYFNFDVGDAEPTDALNLTASIGEINTIRHIVSNRDLQIFTSSSEFYIPSFTAEPITPTNAQIKRQTPFGSSYVRPQSYDGATVYVQANNQVVREYLYSDSEAAYVSSGVSTLSPHLIQQPIQMAVLNGMNTRPESYLFCVCLDGTIALFTSNRSEKRAGWTRITTTNGAFHSVQVIDNAVYTITKYDKGNSTDKFILTQFDPTKNMDFSVSYTGTAGVFDVSSHFNNGAVVSVVNGTDYLGKFTVAGGNVDVSAVEEITSAEIGYEFTVKAETMPIDGQIQGGPLTGQPRSIHKVVVDMRDTLAVNVQGQNLILRNVTDDLSQGRTAFTGKQEFRFLGYDKDPTVVISQAYPLSLDINGLVAELSF